MNQYGASSNYSGYNYQDGSAMGGYSTEGASYGTGWDTQASTPAYGYSQPYSAPSKSKSGSLYKTQLCRHFQSKGYCNMGDGCSFAHGEAELRDGGSGVAPTMPASTYGYAYTQPAPQYNYTQRKFKCFSLTIF